MVSTRLDADTVNRLLDKSHGALAVIYDSVDSTNALAKSFPSRSTPTVIAAREQTAGRGRFDRRFDSPRDSGLYMSIVYSPDSTRDPAQITATAGVAVCLAIERQTGVMPKIKWVNDVYFEGRKLAGILAEGTFSDDGTLFRAVVGIGINVRKRDFPTEIKGVATSIEDAFGNTVDINRLMADTVNIFFSLSSDIPRVMSLYKSLSMVIGKPITVHTPHGTYPAFAKDIDDSGNLIVISVEGEEKKICSGEISIRLA